MINKITAEKIVFALLMASFVIGIWHAFPMLNVINDEMYYVGGPLRAIENHTIIPAINDVPYGTVNYLMSYGVTVFMLIVLLVFFKLDVSALKLFLVQSPQVMYVSLRFVSALLAVIMLFLVNKILKEEFEDTKTRLFLLVLLFTNIITTLILHTGKMWVLSFLLVLTSFYYLYKVVASKNNPDISKRRRNMFGSILFSFLAFANFPLNIFSLVNIPILLFIFRKDKELLLAVVKYAVIGACVFTLVTLLNFGSIKNQIISVFTGYHPINEGVLSKLGFGSSLWSYTLKLLCLYPLLLITLVISAKNKIKNPRLLLISSVYFVVYFLIVVLVANWTGDFGSYMRYLFPLGFFLLFILSSFDITFNKSFYVIGSVAIIFQILTLYYLSVPTTYNQAYAWVNNNLSDKMVIIENSVTELQLVKNKNSSLLEKEGSCVTKCQNIIKYDLNNSFDFTVIDGGSQSVDLSKRKEDIYYIEEKPDISDTVMLVQSFTNPSLVYHSVDYNMGNYFDLSFFGLKNLGKDIYIYKKVK